MTKEMNTHAAVADLQKRLDASLERETILSEAGASEAFWGNYHADSARHWMTKAREMATTARSFRAEAKMLLEAWRATDVRAEKAEAERDAVVKLVGEMLPWLEWSLAFCETAPKRDDAQEGRLRVLIERLREVGESAGLKGVENDAHNEGSEHSP